MTKYSKIIGTGGYLPKNVLTNKAISEMIETTDEWIKTRVGIKQRHVVSAGEDTLTMAVSAAEQALNNANVKAENLDMILVATSTPTKFMPSTACMIQKALNISGMPALDINAACSGFMYALSIADQYIKQKQCKNVLIVGSDTMSKIVDWGDRSTCVLFGDAAGAVVVRADSTPGLMFTDIGADGTYADMLCTFGDLFDDHPSYLTMQGNTVFKYAVKTMEKMVDEVLHKQNISLQEIDWLIPHQANLRIIKATAKLLKMPMSKVITTVEHQGNTTAATIPLALHHAIVEKSMLKSGDLLFLEAFGSGYTWGSALIKY